MNPRRRRLLIPGLLVALLIVVVVASLAGRVDASTVSPCTISDERIDEHSGLAVSRDHESTAYVINDSGSDPEIYAIDLVTCEVVGVTSITGVPWRDPEAIALDGQGTLWVADTGDNDQVRDDAMLYSLPEPGRSGDSTIRPDAHPMTYSDGPQDVEALLIDPVTDAMWLVTKSMWGNGELLRLPDELPTDGVSLADPTGISMPMMVTDATMSPDGRYAIVRTYVGATVYEVADDFAAVEDVALPLQPQGESIAMEPSGQSVLIGSEGVGQPLQRIALDLPEAVVPEPDPVSQELGTGAARSVSVWVVGVTFVGICLGWILIRGVRRP